MNELGLILNFKNKTIDYEHLQVPMEAPSHSSAGLDYITNIPEPKAAAEAVNRVKQILDAKFAPVPPPGNYR